MSLPGLDTRPNSLLVEELHRQAGGTGVAVHSNKQQHGKKDFQPTIFLTEKSSRSIEARDESLTGS